MRRLPSSYNKHNISDAEIDEVFSEVLQVCVEIPLRPRQYGERVLYVGFTSVRMCLVEIGVEDQSGELVIFHAREATAASIQAYEKENMR
jgi:S-adenosylmethionine:tRNA-ribosyltransferase-isomerase (queuine synthetase)